jgi:hypothetical protein
MTNKRASATARTTATAKAKADSSAYCGMTNK